ncbi:MAG: hypothetical protein C4K47_08710 [Candidatus Thorarchaeota archaeon]|nr:MAG: hypothetical protein C4K47_08710 [Candidatus Thorarchaeota archaeon]
MSKRTGGKPQDLREGIVIQTSVELLRKGARRALFEFTELVVKRTGEKKPATSEIEVGDAIVFMEDVDLLPGELVAVKIAGAKGASPTWYVMSTVEVPASGFPTAKDASKAADSEAKKLRILTEFFTKDAGVKVNEVQKWEPDKILDAAQVLAIMAEASRRYGH